VQEWAVVERGVREGRSRRIRRWDGGDKEETKR